jgi:VanZ family protein
MSHDSVSSVRSLLPTRVTLTLRVAAWACIAALAVLSLLPKEEMVRTGADGRLEHFVAYAGTMLVAGLAYGRQVALVRIVVPLIAYAGVLEIGQNFSPGRVPSVLDFAAGAAGVCAAALAVRLWLRPRTTATAASS